MQMIVIVLYLASCTSSFNFGSVKGIHHATSLPFRWITHIHILLVFFNATFWMMRILWILVLSSFEVLTAQPKNENAYILCETCLETAKEMERVLQETKAESRQDVIEKLINGDACERAPFHKHSHLAEDKLRASCLKLFDVYHVEFRTALQETAPDRMDVGLCYEHSTACVGVKRQSLQDHTKPPFMDSHIQMLLQNNQDKVRIPRPVRPAASASSKDEL